MAPSSTNAPAAEMLKKIVSKSECLVSDSDDENVAVTAKADAAEITKAETANAEASEASDSVPPLVDSESEDEAKAQAPVPPLSDSESDGDDDYEEFMYFMEEIKPWVAKVKEMVEQEADRVTVPSFRAVGAVEASDNSMIKKTTRPDRGDGNDYEEFVLSRTNKAQRVAKVRAGQIKKTASSAATVQVTKMGIGPTKTELCTWCQPSSWTDEIILAWIIEHSENDTKKDGKDTKNEQQDTGHALGPCAANATSYLQPPDSNLHSQLKRHFIDSTPIWLHKFIREVPLCSVPKRALNRDFADLKQSSNNYKKCCGLGKAHDIRKLTDCGRCCSEFSG